MRLLQNILLVIGAASLGTFVSFWIVVLLISLVQAPSGEPWTRGFGQFIGGMILAPAGGVAGLLVALGWMRVRNEHQTWRPQVWLGILLGCAVGFWGMNIWAEHGGMDSWIAQIPAIAASGLIGGSVASVIKPKSRPLSSSRRRNVDR